LRSNDRCLVVILSEEGVPVLLPARRTLATVIASLPVLASCGGTLLDDPSSPSTLQDSGVTSGSSSDSGSSASTGGRRDSGSTGSSSGVCTINAQFTYATCPECTACVQSKCCSVINDCYGDLGCTALFNCINDCYNSGVLPDDASVPIGGDCSALCLSAVDSSAESTQLFMTEDNCWEGCTPLL
jgi:hypothetical protein